MSETSLLPIVIILLAAAVVTVSLFRKLHISPILGYLAVGAILGPGGLDIVDNNAGTSELAELGLVFLLFIIGLELSWERLKVIRRQAFALGFLQIIVTVSVTAGALFLFKMGGKTALIIGSGLAMSSTALAMQLVTENNQKASQVGRMALTILLIQDMAVVPLLILVTALGGDHAVGADLGMAAFKAIAALVVIFFVGRLILRPLYRVVASLENPEIFTALTLLVVLGTGWFTYRAGLSLALGAFLAGLLMAETEYRHQVEADVMPFKGLLLGLFFIVIGMSVNLHLVWVHLPFITSMALLLIVVKGLLIAGLCRLLGFSFITGAQLGALLSQGGEFAFVLFRMATDNDFLGENLETMLNSIVIVSMALTPVAVVLSRMLSTNLEYKKRRKAEDSDSEIKDVRDHVVIIGFGRVGQMIAKLLSAENMHYIAIDTRISIVSKAKRIGLPVYYGEGSRREVLNAIGLARASAVIVTTHDPASSEATVKSIHVIAPHIPVIARALDLSHMMVLEAAGADIAVSDIFEASLQLGGMLLKSIGVADHEILRIMQIFRDRDYALAQGAIEVDMENTTTPYHKMLAFQKSNVSGAKEEEV